MNLKPHLPLFLLFLAAFIILACGGDPTPTPVPAAATPSPDRATVSPDATIAIAVPSDAVASAPASTPTPAPIVMVGISGRVQDDDGTPLGEALVRADGSEAMTDPDGFFDLPEVILRLGIPHPKKGTGVGPPKDVRNSPLVAIDRDGTDQLVPIDGRQGICRLARGCRRDKARPGGDDDV